MQMFALQVCNSKIYDNWEHETGYQWLGQIFHCGDTQFYMFLSWYIIIIMLNYILFYKFFVKGILRGVITLVLHLQEIRNSRDIKG